MTLGWLYLVGFTLYASAEGLRISKPIVNDDSAVPWRSWGSPKAKQGKSESSSTLPSNTSAKIVDDDGSKDAQDVVLVDAGSSGSKVFAFSPNKSAAKLLTQCTDAHRQAGKTLQGIAALSYKKEDCEWTIGSSGELEPLAQETPDYANALLKLLADTYKSASGRNDVSRVKNRDQVPMLATAGMRLVSQGDNAKVWAYLCGKSHAGLAIAPAGAKCGTVPGTTEAYFEFLANAVNGQSKILTGTFTVGGASSQISIPLKTPTDVDAFLSLKESIAQELDCTKLKLASGDQAPFFNTIKLGGPTKECIDDYITYRPKSEITARESTEKENIRVAEIQGVGLISFLGLEGRGTFVAGGVNQIHEWAVGADCDTEKLPFHVCEEKLRTALSADVMWKHVTAYFRNNSLNVNAFSYNTPAAIPKMQGLEQVNGSNQGWDLEVAVSRKCDPDNAAKFGYKKGVTCMKALYTSLYVTSFFSENGTGHHKSELHFDPKRDWAEGMVEVATALLQDKGAYGLAGTAKGLVLQHSDDSFVRGARIHFDDAGI